MWVEEGSRWNPVPPGTQVEKLAPGIYVYRATMFGWYLEKIRERFEFPFRIFDFDSTAVKRVTLAWSKETEGNLGVLLNGVKGTGKTVSAQLIANEMVDRGLPVLLVAEPIPLGNILEEIRQEVVLFFDEFEKTHHEEADQQRLLSVLDGASRSKFRRMYLLVTNNPTLDDNLVDRPGRIRYNFQYERLSREALEMVVDAYLDESKIRFRDDVVGWLCQRKVISIDGAIKTIQEVNAFDQPPSSFEKFFNLSTQETSSYRVEISFDGKSWEELSAFFSVSDEGQNETLRTLLTGGSGADTLLTQAAERLRALRVTSGSRGCALQFLAKTDEPGVFSAIASVKAYSTWMGPWIEKFGNGCLGPIYSEHYLALDPKPDDWVCPLTSADVTKTGKLSARGYAAIESFFKTKSVHGTPKTNCFVRIQPNYFNTPTIPFVY